MTVSPTIDQLQLRVILHLTTQQPGRRIRLLIRQQRRTAELQYCISPLVTPYGEESRSFDPNTRGRMEERRGIAMGTDHLKSSPTDHGVVYVVEHSDSGGRDKGR
ncbi:hypothetical protein B0H19DRAFT_706563 [Mycena capillaripes]|nr:hypothetical protein B0H19DRAFT_706563 [Mycena capillaripes]